MKAFQFTLAAVFVTLAFFNSVYSTPDDFLVKLFEEYPSYLANNSLDPSRPYPETYNQIWDQPTIQLNFTIANLRFHNLSQRSFDMIEHRVNLTGGTMLAVFNMSSNGFSIDGDYFAEGQVRVNETWVPIRGQGRWNGTSASPNGALYMVHYYRSGITVNPNGYADLRYAILHTEFRMGTQTWVVEGLNAGGQEEQISRGILTSLFDKIGSENLPIHRQIRDYLTQSFGTTPISDM